MNTGTWTECEHKNFLLGLSIYGRGKWKKIAIKFVKTRNATQVASHAQKYMKKRRFVKPIPRHPGPDWHCNIKAMGLI